MAILAEEQARNPSPAEVEVRGTEFAPYTAADSSCKAAKEALYKLGWEGLNNMGSSTHSGLAKLPAEFLVNRGQAETMRQDRAETKGGKAAFVSSKLARPDSSSGQAA